jgi:hypothetical protein
MSTSSAETTPEAQPAKTTLFAGGNQGNVRRNHFL